MYTSISGLPTSTQKLPYNGKIIYMKFFNRAYEKYHSDATADKLAWQAVRRKYVKHNHTWVPRVDANSYDTTTTDETTDTDDDDDDDDDEDTFYVY
nr:ChaB-Like [Mamestra configurata nucleopolyhedrovirus B]WRQ97014.1 macoB127 [Mamestra configurata nucleopolyhedrovirus B]